MTTAAEFDHLPLGRPTRYTGTYTPSLLQSVPRARLRAGFPQPLPFVGVDLWQGYEVSWLNPRGRPEVATLRMEVPCASRAMVESKSLKLYLNSLNQTEFESRAEVLRTLESDIGLAAGAPVLIELPGIEDLRTEGLAAMPGLSLDTLEIDVRHYRVEPAFLVTQAGPMVRETLFTHLFRSVCPVTGQPDWATVQVQYSGRPIDQVGLLRYLISYRDEPGFHEATVERIFVDIHSRCAPDALSVFARFNRRGGLDISPFRTSSAEQPRIGRLARQ